MAHTSLYDQHLSHEEIKFREHFQRGLDFIKIELYRSAREEFKAALRFNPESEEAKTKMLDCDENIRKDARKVYLLVPVVLAIIAAIIIFA